MVSYNSSENSKNKTFIVDLFPSTIHLHEKGEGNDVALELFETSHPLTPSTKLFTSAEELKTFLRSETSGASYFGNTNEITVILGRHSDPFFPFEGKFHLALKLIEAIAESNITRIIIQTRSSLILLAMPILQAIRERLTITIALESRDDQLHLRHSPQHPRPSERIKVARSLKRFGFKTVIQAAPTRDERNIAGYARLIDDLSTFITMPQLTKKTPYGTFVIEHGRIRTLSTLLNSICPRKIISSVLSDSGMELGEALLRA